MPASSRPPSAAREARLRRPRVAPRSLLRAALPRAARSRLRRARPACKAREARPPPPVRRAAVRRGRPSRRRLPARPRPSDRASRNRSDPALPRRSGPARALRVSRRARLELGRASTPAPASPLERPALPAPAPRALAVACTAVARSSPVRLATRSVPTTPRPRQGPLSIRAWSSRASAPSRGCASPPRTLRQEARGGA
jgi:hypothetical protein